jgi:uncharacterized membrane protein
MSIPVIVASNGQGIPVVNVTKNAPAAKVATNGQGVPIVIVTTNGQPMIVSGVTP